MITTKDRIWLEKVIDECFSSTDECNVRDQKLEGFSMLVKGMVKNIEKNIDETEVLWENDPTSSELKARFNLLRRCLSYLERYCHEKLEGGENG